MNQDYYDIANSIGETISKCSKALTNGQQIVLTGALAVYFNKSESENAVLKQELQALRDQEPICELELIDLQGNKQRFPVFTDHMPAREGWKLVPSIPTDEMINAYIDSPDMTNWKDDFISGYKAMLEAAPKEPS